MKWVMSELSTIYLYPCHQLGATPIRLCMLLGKTVTCFRYSVEHVVNSPTGLRVTCTANSERRAARSPLPESIIIKQVYSCSRPADMIKDKHAYSYVGTELVSRTGSSMPDAIPDHT